MRVDPNAWKSRDITVWHDGGQCPGRMKQDKKPFRDSSQNAGPSLRASVLGPPSSGSLELEPVTYAPRTSTFSSKQWEQRGPPGPGDSSERWVGTCREATMCHFSGRCGNNHHENNNNGRKEDKLPLSENSFT